MLWEFSLRGDLQIYVEFEPCPVFRWVIGEAGENPEAE